MQYMTMEAFKLHVGKWGFLSVEVDDETLQNRRPSEVANFLAGAFKKKAELENAILVKDSMHTYNDHDKAMFGLSENPGKTRFLMYMVKR